MLFPLFLIRVIRAIRGQIHPLGGGDVSSPWPPLATQNFLGRDVPAPTHTINYFGGGDVPSPHLPRLRNQHPLGRDVPAPIHTINYFGVGDVPAPIQTLNYFGVGDVPSPNLPRHRNPELSGTRRPSPDPQHQLLRGRRRLVAVAPQRGRMTAQIESGAAWAWRVLRPSAWSAGLRSLPRSLKAEVRHAEPRKDALRVTQQRRDRGFRGFRG